MVCQGFADRLAPSASSREDPAWWKGQPGIPCDDAMMQGCSVQLFADWMLFDLRFVDSETFCTEYDRAWSRACFSDLHLWKFAGSLTNTGDAPVSPRVAEV